MLLYKNMLLEESGDTGGALAHLDSCEAQILDKLGLKEKRGQLLLGLGRFDEAAGVYADLLSRNVENGGYHAGRQAAALRSSTIIPHWHTIDVSPDTEGVLRELYAGLQKQYPRSEMSRRLPLDFVQTAETFRDALTTYAMPVVRKGVPSLYANLKPLASTEWKRNAMTALFGEWLASLEASGCLPGSGRKELPSTVLWIRVLVALHSDQCGDSAKALEQIDMAIEHTPTLVDLYIFKARIFKHAGELQLASDWMEQARGMDLADRYLNTKSTRYLLRADRIEQAQNIIALFTKDGDGPSNLFDMQCMWYELESAASYLRIGDFGRALKSFTSVEKHFSDIVEDQFDFHTYCIRKMTLRAYVRMLRLEDRVWGHHFYVRAARGVIETYMRIVDCKEGGGAQAAAAEMAADDEMSAAERKKADSKRKKAEAKAKAEAEAKKEAEKTEGANAKGKKGVPKERAPDEDPDGATLAAVADPLDRASAYLRTLQAHAPSDLQTHTYAYEVAMRKKKYLLALRGLLKAQAIAPADASMHARVGAGIVPSLKLSDRTIRPGGHQAGVRCAKCADE